MYHENLIFVCLRKYAKHCCNIKSFTVPSVLVDNLSRVLSTFLMSQHCLDVTALSCVFFGAKHHISLDLGSSKPKFDDSPIYFIDLNNGLSNFVINLPVNIVLPVAAWLLLFPGILMVQPIRPRDLARC